MHKPLWKFIGFPEMWPTQSAHCIVHIGMTNLENSISGSQSTMLCGHTFWTNLCDKQSSVFPNDWSIQPTFDVKTIICCKKEGFSINEVFEFTPRAYNNDLCGSLGGGEIAKLSIRSPGIDSWLG